MTQKFVYASKNDLSEYGSKNYEFLKSKLNEDSLIERFNPILDEMNDLVSVIMSTYNSEATDQLQLKVYLNNHTQM